MGFIKASTNQTIDISSFNFKFDYVINSDRQVQSPFINSIYQLKWKAELVNFGVVNDINANLRDLIYCGFYRLVNNEQYVCEEVFNCDSQSLKCSFSLSFKNDIKLGRDYQLRIQLVPFNSVYFSTNFLDVSVRQELKTANLYLRSNMKAISSVSFSRSSLFTLNNRLKLKTELKIERAGIMNETIRVYYSTKEFTNQAWVYFNDIKVYTADSGYDFEGISTYVTFLPNETEQTITINLRATSILSNFGSGPSPLIASSDNELSNSLYPRIFQVILSKCSPNCFVNSSGSIANVTILSENLNLWRIYRQALIDEQFLNFNELELRSVNPKPAINSIESELIIQTLQKIINDQFNLVNSDSSDRLFISTRQTRLLNLFCNLMNPNRQDLDGKIKYLNLLEDLLYTSIGGVRSECLNTSNLIPKKFECTSNSFNYACNRIDSSAISEIIYLGEYFSLKMPVKSAPICFDTCVIEFKSTNLIEKLSYHSALNNKALSVSLRPIFPNGSSVSHNILKLNSKDLSSISDVLINPILIRMPFKKAVQTEKQCSVFNTDKSEWEYEICETKRAAEYIECKCYHRSIYALTRPLDSGFYYGFNYAWFYVSVSFKLFADLLTILTYFLCLTEYSYFSVSFIQFLFVNMLTHILYLITVGISPSILGEEINRSKFYGFLTS